MAKRRKMSALQRKYFGGGRKRRRSSTRRATARRSSSRAAPKRRRSSGFGGSSSWLPNSIENSLVTAGAGVTYPLVSGFVAEKIPYGDMSFLGDYADEGRSVAIGAILHKFGGKVPAVGSYLKQAGRAYWDYGFFSAGIQTSPMLLGNLTGTNSSAASGGVVYN